MSSSGPNPTKCLKNLILLTEYVSVYLYICIFEVKMQDAVLIVEDDIATQKFLEKVVLHCGYGSRIASNVDQTRTILACFIPKLILLDIGLPGVDGLTIAKQLRRIPQLEEIPIIVISGNINVVEFDMREAIRNSGVNDVVDKPINAERLIETIGKYLPIKEAEKVEEEEEEEETE
ncbi:MAG: CheY-like chemotaxis protein [Chlamydiales bacterium]|jgi:CheY-like chemotaxis protein